MSKFLKALELDHREEMEAIECAKAVLAAKLNVAELRVLYRHYFKTDSEGLNKQDLVDEIAPEYAEQEYGL